MRRQPESFAVAVRAFKEMTATTDDAAATRARVLAAADRSTRAHAPRDGSRSRRRSRSS